MKIIIYYNSKLFRTTNSAESFHRTYNSQFYTSHPAIYVVIKILIETQAETLLKIATIEQDKKKEMPIKQKDKILNIHSKYMWYVGNKNSNNLLKYLEYVGLRYPAITDI